MSQSSLPTSMGVPAIRIPTSIFSDPCESHACLPATSSVFAYRLSTPCHCLQLPVYDCYVFLPDGINRNIKLVVLT
ncbi:hypothetical protein CY34DRAFT_805783 [Suillus luteus UH-Slu-Lm8-n1]|uniref:Uncharacterized protein n=1 Tax=Suillus luteus UH-Slu-Lm8-n1 TaxID=930992 RepID=A0A0D0AIH9_9AGAM|nr:hypothetical protein CY34DRAFT_805783 [Suillus luteus UH-Slu-Lm8-n1]